MRFSDGLLLEQGNKAWSREMVEADERERCICQQEMTLNQGQQTKLIESGATNKTEQRNNSHHVSCVIMPNYFNYSSEKE